MTTGSFDSARAVFQGVNELKEREREPEGEATNKGSIKKSITGPTPPRRFAPPLLC